MTTRTEAEVSLEQRREVPRLAPEQVAQLRAKWRRLQEGGLLGEDGLPLGRPEDYLPEEASEQVSEDRPG